MRRRIGICGVLVLLLAACANVPGLAPASRAVVLAMPYIPNVQFSQYYVAASRGYYAAEGLNVTFDYNFETDVVQRVAQGTVQFGMASGDSVLLARAQGLPVRTIATTSQQFPTVFYSKADAGIRTPADLKGRTVGIPGRFGASYIGLRAILYASQMSEADLTIQEIGFAQVPALLEDKVEVASGYGNNEPVQLERQGVALNIIRVADIYPLASDGIIAGESLISGDPALVQGFVRATLRGMADVIADPDAAFTIALTFIPELAAADAATQDAQRAVLRATLPYWQSDTTQRDGLGTTNLMNWQATHEFLRAAAILQQDVDVSQAFTNEFVAGSR